MLWLALYLPQLQLDDAGRGLDPAPPLALLLDRRVVAVNPTARKLGVRAGSSQAEAMAVCPTLHRVSRDETREAELLQQLAGWALQYSSLVCVEPPLQLLLEIGGSRRLFGEAGKLCGCILDGLKELGYSARTGVAPTPLAAALLARAACERMVDRLEDLPGVIAPLPVPRLVADAKIAQRLHRAGIRRVGQLLDLPPAALSRRCGPALSQQLLRLLGRLPDPRQGIDTPACFDQRLELPVTVGDISALLFPLRRLLRGLSGYLAARDAGINGFTLRLVHHEPPATELELRLRDASADFARLERLASERLDVTRLRAPVREIQLLATRFGEVPRGSTDLLDGDRAQSNLPAALERITARLGESAVYQLCVAADHRPERAQQRGKPEGKTALPAALGPRPLWLLDEPQPSELPLQIESGPERIESGWWDDGVRRDYYVARDRHGSRYWVFETLTKPGQWFIHGIFS